MPNLLTGRSVSGAAGASVPLPKLSTPQRKFQVQLQVEEVKGSQVELIGRPALIAEAGQEMHFASGNQCAVLINHSVRRVLSGMKIDVVIYASDPQEELDLDMTVSRTAAAATAIKNGALFASDSVHLLQGIALGKPVHCELKPKDGADAAIRVTATVTEIPVEKTIQSAEKDFRVAEFYRRAQKNDSALFYYQLICKRYPDTLYAAQAKERIEALKKAMETDGRTGR